jgi:hypothetical protein
MKSNLYDLAVDYVRLIERIERTNDRFELQELEEQRTQAHNAFADALKYDAT